MYVVYVCVYVCVYVLVHVAYVLWSVVLVLFFLVWEPYPIVLSA